MSQDHRKREVLKLFYEERLEEATPGLLVYRMHMSPGEAEQLLDDMTLDGMLELDSDENGSLFYRLPDHERDRLKRMPPPERSAAPSTPAYQAPNGPVDPSTITKKGAGKGARRPMPGRGGPAPYGPQHGAPYGGVQPGHYMVPAGGNQMTPYGLHPNPNHNPGVALILALLFPGAGQLYNGEAGKAVGVFLGSVLLSPILIGFFIWFWALFDAYNVGRKRQMGIP